MFWISLSLAGTLPKDLDKSVQRWFRGAAPSQAFDVVKAHGDAGLRGTLRERGVTKLEFAGMELEIVVNEGQKAKTLRLFLDPRKPARPIVRSIEIHHKEPLRSHDLGLWARRAPGVAKLAEQVMAGFRESRCPTSWGEPVLPAGLPTKVDTSLRRSQLTVADNARATCDLALEGTVTSVAVDDISWFAFEGDVPIGVLRGELELGRDELVFEFGGLRAFE